MSAVDPRSSSTPEAAGETQASSHAAEAGVGEGSAGAGQGDSPEVEVVAGDSAGGVPVILPAPVYNKKEEVVEVDRGVVDAVDRFRAPADFVPRVGTVCDYPTNEFCEFCEGRASIPYSSVSSVTVAPHYPVLL